MDDLPSLRRQLNKHLARLQVIRSQYRGLVKTLGAANDHILAATEAQEMAQAVAQAVQQQAHDQIAKVVSQCLTAVFDEPYTFHIIFERKRGRTEAQLVFDRDGMTLDPMTATGGGVVDVAAFALRLSCLILHKPPLRRILILDEPFKYVSEEYRPRVRELLETLSEEMGVQFLMVTHIQELKTGTVLEIG